MRKSLLILFILNLVSCGLLLPIKVDEASDSTIESTPERLARGEYLAEHVSGCIDCHSLRDWSLYMAPAKPETRGAGGEMFGEDLGVIYAPNITPAALGSWTDGEIVRAIASGVNKDGVPLFPIMPYPNYGRMSEEDIFSIVVYLRTLKPIENQVAKRTLNFPFNLVVRTIPQQAEYGTVPYPSDAVAYGKYMITAAGCADCHTPIEKGRPIEGMDFAGGFTMGVPSGGVINSANITPHETGIKNWTRDRFIQRFKAMDTEAARSIPLAKDQINTIMPWTYYATMRAEDLGAIYDYLVTVPPVDNEVIQFPEDE